MIIIQFLPLYFFNHWSIFDFFFMTVVLLIAMTALYIVAIIAYPFYQLLIRDVFLVSTTLGVPDPVTIVKYLKRNFHDEFPHPIKIMLAEIYDGNYHSKERKQYYINIYIKKIMKKELDKITKEIFNKNLDIYNYYAFECYVLNWLYFYQNGYPVRMHNKQGVYIGSGLISNYISISYKKKFSELTIDEKIDIILDNWDRRKWGDVYNFHKRAQKKYFIARNTIGVNIENAYKNVKEFPKEIGVINTAIYEALINNNIDDILREILIDNTLIMNEMIDNIYQSNLYQCKEKKLDKIVESAYEAKIKREKDEAEKRNAANKFLMEQREKNDKELMERKLRKEQEIKEQQFKESQAFKLISESVEVVTHLTTYPGVYAIVNRQTFDFYIGESQNIYFRKLTHLGQLVDKGSIHHNNKLQHDFDQFGQSAFEFYVIEKVINDNSIGSARKRIEEYLIKLYQPKYNSVR